MWHWDLEEHAGNGPQSFPEPKAHPTKGVNDDTIQKIEAKGPIGYFIAAVVRMGVIVDGDL